MFWNVFLSAMGLLCSVVAFSAGRHIFPSPVALHNAWLDGQEDFVRRNQEADREAWGGREPSTFYAEWLAEGQEPEPRWDDTSDHLAQLAAPYYELLIRGAGGPSSGTTFAPVTTAPWAGEDSQRAPKGDSPGSGPFTGEFPTSPVYDALAAQYLPPRAGNGVSPPGPATTVGLTPAGPAPAGPGAADPWQEITEASHDVWEVFSDAEVFGMLHWEIDALRRKLGEPFQLTPWKEK